MEEVPASLSNTDKIATLERMLAQARALQPAQAIEVPEAPIGKITVPSELNDILEGYDVPVLRTTVAASPASSVALFASSVLDNCDDGSPKKKRRVQINVLGTRKSIFFVLDYLYKHDEADLLSYF